MFFHSYRKKKKKEKCIKFNYQSRDSAGLLSSLHQAGGEICGEREVTGVIRKIFICFWWILGDLLCDQGTNYNPQQIASVLLCLISWTQSCELKANKYPDLYIHMHPIILKAWPFTTLEKYGLHRAVPGRGSIFPATIASRAPSSLNFSLSLPPSLFLFSAWLLQLPPGWGCSSNPNKTPFFSYWPSWHVMENQANYPYSCFHLLFM